MTYLFKTISVWDRHKVAIMEKSKMSTYEILMDAVIRLVASHGGQMEMSSVFRLLGDLPPDFDGTELAWKLGRDFGYLEPYSKVGKGNWVLSDKGWERYKFLQA